MSCPSSGDGDCVPEVIDKNQTSNIQYQQNSIQNISNNYESDDGNQSDKYILTESNNIKNINKKSKLKSEIDKLNLEIDDIIYSFIILTKLRYVSLCLAYVLLCCWII